MEPAGPYPEAGLALPKYNPNAVFPITNNKEVTKAPIHTDRHLIFASGNILNINANNMVMVTNEKMAIKLMIEYPSIIKRPVIEMNNKIIVGYNETYFSKNNGL